MHGLYHHIGDETRRDETTAFDKFGQKHVMCPHGARHSISMLGMHHANNLSRQYVKNHACIVLVVYLEPQEKTGAPGQVTFVYMLIRMPISRSLNVAEVSGHTVIQ
jgi:hypothetical protein